MHVRIGAHRIHQIVGRQLPNALGAEFRGQRVDRGMLTFDLGSTGLQRLFQFRATPRLRPDDDTLC